MGARSLLGSTIRRAVLRLTRRFARAEDGAIAVVFAVLLVPMILGVGISVDYMRAYNAHSEMQAELDVALVAAIKSVDKVNKKKLEDIIEKWFATQTRITQYKVDNVVVDTANSTITATAFAKVPTTFLLVGGIEKVDVAVTSQIAGPSSSFLDVYLVLDKSASMLLAATTAGQQTMRANVGCEFACHGADGGPLKVGGKTYATNYEYSVAADIKLRSDVMLAAIDRVHREPACDECRRQLQSLLWPLLPRPAAGIETRAAPNASGRAYLEALRASEAAR